MKIKMFTSNDCRCLEQEVNQFLADRNIKLRQISNTESEKLFTIMIVYEPRMDVIEQ